MERPRIEVCYIIKQLNYTICILLVYKRFDWIDNITGWFVKNKLDRASVIEEQHPLKIHCLNGVRLYTVCDKLVLI